MEEAITTIDTLFVYTKQRLEEDIEGISEEKLLKKDLKEELDLRKTREYMKKSFKGFEIVRELGRGSHGKNKIYLIKKQNSFQQEDTDLSNTEEYAMKKISIIRKEKNKKDCTETELENYEKNRQKAVEQVLESERRSATILKDSQYVVKMLGYELWDYDYDDEFGTCMFVQMKVYETLKEQMRKGKQFLEYEINEIARDIGRALEDCEDNQIIHCDIKPSNIFYDREENRYLLGDFGVSVYKEDAEMIGYTILYAAPEQLRKEEVDFYTDVYSLGLTLYQIANNNHYPFSQYKGKTCEDNILMRLEHREDLGFPKGIKSKAFGQVLIKACKYDIAKRYQSITEFLDALDEIDFSTETSSSDEEDSTRIYLDKREDSAQEIEYTGKCGENVFYTFKAVTGHLEIYGEGEMLSVSYYSNEKSLRLELEEEFHVISEFESFIEDVVKITIREKITKIDELAFANFPNLKYVVIGPDMKKIPKRCFMYCKKLENVFLPENLLEIDDMAFWGCESLEEINFPKNMYRIGVAAFKKCKRLERLSLSKIQEIDWFAFQESGLEKVYLWDIKRIGREAFSGTFRLKNVYIGSYWMIEKACFANSTIAVLEIGRERGELGYKIEDDILVSCKNLKKINLNMESECKTKAFELYKEILTVQKASVLKQIERKIFMKSINSHRNRKNYNKIKREYEKILD